MLTVNGILNSFQLHPFTQAERQTVLCGLVFLTSSWFEISPEVHACIARGHGDIIIISEMLSVLGHLFATKLADLLVNVVEDSAKL